MEAVAVVLLGMSGIVGWFDILVCHGKIGTFIASRYIDPVKAQIAAEARKL